MLYCPKEEEKVVKIIFLDIDGVLTHTDYLNWQTRHIDPERVRFLAKIVELTDAQIVLTSTWKDGYDRQSGKKDDYYVVLEHVLAEHDLKIYTGDLSQVIVFLLLLMLTVRSTTSPRRCTMTVLL